MQDFTCNPHKNNNSKIKDNPSIYGGIVIQDSVYVNKSA